MKVFVTGVAGFLGSHIAEQMLLRGHEVIGNDNLIGGDLDNVPKGVVFYETDCHELPRFYSLMHSVDLVYNCAALAYEGLSVFSPYTVVDSIIGASTAVFSAAVRANVQRIVHCSSMARYGALVPPFKESMPCLPQDPYGIAKLATEKVLANLARVHGFEHVIAVPHNIYGPRQKYDDPYRNVAAIMMNRCLQGKFPIIYGNGLQLRCFSFISDCLSCLLKLGDLDNRDVVGEVINIGPDEERVSINELAGLIMSITGYSGIPQHVPGRPQEVREAICSSDKARALLDYRTKTSLQQGLEIMCGWMEKRGPREFKYHLPLEIVTAKTPKTWTERLM